MKHDDVPGYTELRAKLFQIRFKLQVLKTEEERAKLNMELKNVKREMARLLIEHKREEQMKGR